MSARPDPRHECGLALMGQGRLTAMALTDAERKNRMSHVFLMGGGLSKTQIDRVPLEGAFQRFLRWLMRDAPQQDPTPKD